MKFIEKWVNRFPQNDDLSTACYPNMGQNMGQIVCSRIALNFSELFEL